uniref:Crustin 4 n=1 Tax=Panulirus japonicus TaxID=6736 RepID=C7B731_PANJA|nr:crustin 4 [Panulirus japonicus]
MLRLVLLCVLGLAVGQEDKKDTRFFGGGVGSVLGGVHGGVHGVVPGVVPGVSPGVVPGQSSSCRYWCRTPQGQAYCCENASRPSGPVGTKPGRCPPVRPNCPPVRTFGGPPQTCSNDYSCAGSDKCCYDTCLREHVCKPPQYTGVPFGRR